MNFEQKQVLSKTPPSDTSDSETSPERRVVDSLTSAVLLAFADGTLDAFLYLNHGQVYAGVMTGNAVLCGLALSQGNLQSTIHCASSLFAYVCGIWLVSMVQWRVKRHPVRVSLACVSVGLLIASFFRTTSRTGPMSFLSRLSRGSWLASRARWTATPTTSPCSRARCGTPRLPFISRSIH